MDGAYSASSPTHYHVHLDKQIEVLCQKRSWKHFLLLLYVFFLNIRWTKLHGKKI